MFSHFSRAPTCDRHRAIGYTTLSRACVVKIIVAVVYALSIIAVFSLKISTSGSVPDINSVKFVLHLVLCFSVL